MAGKNKYDPLEAAKVTPASMKQDDELVAAQPAQPAQAVASGRTPQAQPAPAPPPAPSVKTVDQPVTKRVMYEVEADKTVSIGGQMNRLKVGTRLDPAGYGGEPGIQKLIDVGLKLKKIEV